MTARQLVEMIRKRWAAPRWVVIEDVANATGASVSRHADAIACGIWPSDGYRIIGFETKVSRGDVKKELGDPRKADAVGKYCDEWHLVVSDLSIIDGLEIPASWGILVPKNRVLHTHRKAPKREATPMGRAFCAAIVRKVVKSWVSKDEHERVKENVREIVRGELKQEREWEQQKLDIEYQRLKQKVAAFKNESGIDLEAATVWNVGNVARAVKAVLDARETGGSNAAGRNALPDPVALIKREADQLRAAAQRHGDAAKRMEAMAFNVDQLAERYAAEAPIDPLDAAEWARKRAEDPTRLVEDIDLLEL